MTAPRITVEHTLTGRLGPAYPAARHDLELRVSGVPTEELAAVLTAESERILREEPACRKVVFAAPAGDVAVMEAAEAAGFRYVVDVDIAADPAGPHPDGHDGTLELSLLVREPDFVTQVDPDLDHVPQT
ncbi:hypothetical protein AB3X52_08275 [Nocardioides sp. DS6]|uniref:Uncharacterized protein n=1 Tax=Nocardioides eburneus TaxID=3231482 RepID=A0ABV3SXE8_9ACTN